MNTPAWSVHRSQSRSCRGGLGPKSRGLQESRCGRYGCKRDQHKVSGGVDGGQCLEHGWRTDSRQVPMHRIFVVSAWTIFPHVPFSHSSSLRTCSFASPLHYPFLRAVSAPLVAHHSPFAAKWRLRPVAFRRREYSRATGIDRNSDMACAHVPSKMRW